MKLTTQILVLLFGMSQGYGDARKVPGDLVFSIMESKLDDSLTYLDGDNARRAREHIEIEKEFGSFQAYLDYMASFNPFRPINTEEAFEAVDMKQEASGLES